MPTLSRCEKSGCLAEGWHNTVTVTIISPIRAKYDTFAGSLCSLPALHKKFLLHSKSQNSISRSTGTAYNIVLHTKRSQFMHGITLTRIRITRPRNNWVSPTETRFHGVTEWWQGRKLQAGSNEMRSLKSVGQITWLHFTPGEEVVQIGAAEGARSWS